MKYIGFTKVSLPYGWLGNMSPHPIKYKGKIWRTCECLFQSLRFNDKKIVGILRNEKSPMGVKMKSKGYRDKMVIDMMGEEDVDNMKMVVKLKYDSYKWMRDELKKLKGDIIYEDVSSRRGRGSRLFWGGELVSGRLIGENVLGKIWMDLI